jgi:hypothetical protein
MSASSSPFSLPSTLSPTLARVRDYWIDLKRADNDMPFWDDVKLAALADAVDRALLIDAFEMPQRFRFNTVGKILTETYGKAVNGEFIDEVDLHAPFGELDKQCAATVAARAPTYFAGGAAARILLPMWGDGHIGMLLGAVD